MWHKQIKSLSSNRESVSWAARFGRVLFFGGNGGNSPKPFFETLFGVWFQRCFLFHLQTSGRASPDVWMGRNPKAITKGSCPGLRQESYTRGFAKGFCHGFLLSKNMPKIAPGGCAKGLLHTFDVFYPNLKIKVYRYMQSGARALFNWDMNGQTVQMLAAEMTKTRHCWRITKDEVHKCIDIVSISLQGYCLDRDIAIIQILLTCADI